jgi:hypothetical protein
MQSHAYLSVHRGIFSCHLPYNVLTWAMYIVYVSSHGGYVQAFIATATRYVYFSPFGNISFVGFDSMLCQGMRIFIS